MTAAERLIVALDVADLESARRLVQRVAPHVTSFKVGSELFTACGPAAVELVQKVGGRVFLDLKFHDIPNTVARAARVATRLGVWMFNLHVQGGAAMLREATAAVNEETRRAKGPRPLVVGVTVLTSMAERDLADLGIRKTMKDQVLYLAQLAQKAGLDGIVASAQETQVLRFACGPQFVIVTPGIRPAGAQWGDQQRVETPAVAVRAGATYLVVGRPITEAPDPAAAAQGILRELEG